MDDLYDNGISAAFGSLKNAPNAATYRNIETGYSKKMKKPQKSADVILLSDDDDDDSEDNGKLSFRFFGNIIGKAY